MVPGVASPKRRARPKAGEKSMKKLVLVVVLLGLVMGSAGAVVIDPFESGPFDFVEVIVV